MKHTPIKAVSLCLALLLLALPLASCDLFGKPEARSEAFAAVKDGSAATVVYPAESNSEWKALANELTRVIKRITGVVPEITTEVTQASGKRILLGTVACDESREALAALGGERAFSFSVSGDSLVIAAPDTATLGMAISYFEAQFDSALRGETGDGTLIFPADLSVTRKMEASSAEPSQLASSLAALRLAGSDLAGIPADGELDRVSGTAVVGNVLYAALRDAEGKKVRLVAVELSTGKKAAESEVLPLENSGGMCYNPVLDLLVLTGHGTKISLIDPATLTVRRTVTAGASVFGITYDAKNACYYALEIGGSQVVKLNRNFAVSDGKPLDLTAPAPAGEDFTLINFCSDSENFYLLYFAFYEGTSGGGLLVTQSKTEPKRRSYLELPGVTSPCALSVDERSFCVVSADDPGLAGKVTRFAFYTDTAVREPADLFNEGNTGTVDTSYLFAEELFWVYSFTKSTYKRNTVMQGACTDGKYGYFFLEYQGGNGNYSNSQTHDTVIVKMNMATRELVKFSEPMKLGHSNDGCYNPNTGELLVVYNGNDKTLVKVIDTESLTIREEKRLPFSIFSLAYNSAARQYVAGRSGGRDFGILDEDFNVVTDRVSTDYSGYDKDEIYDYKLGTNLLTQGIDCDSRYVYFVLSGRVTGGWKNYLLAFDYSGRHIFTKVLPTASLEVENVFHIGAAVYVTCNGSKNGSRNPCYRISVLPKEE